MVMSRRTAMVAISLLAASTTNVVDRPGIVARNRVVTPH